jgi:cysteine desulfurase/selenocysteine lyase
MNADRREFVRTCAAVGVGVAPILAGAAAQVYVEHERTIDPTAQLRDRFPAIVATGGGFVYLDSAATTHRLQAVLDAVADFYVAANANPARVHAPARRAAERLAQARQTIATFVNARDPLEIVFTRGTTEAVNLAAASWGSANLRAGDEVVLTIAEHNSNLLPWVTAAKRAGANVLVVDVDDDGNLRLDDLKRKLSPRTRLVAFSHVSNVLGIVNPAKEIAVAARAAGATVFIDGAQAAPHVPIDVRDIDCDFYAFSGHKMCGPMGSGVLWARRELLDAMPPYHVGSNMAHEVDFERATFEHAALKFQAGTPDVAQPVGLAAAAHVLMASRDVLQSHDRALVERGIERLKSVRGLRVIGDAPADRRVPVFSFTIDGWKAEDVAAALDKHEIAVRAGDLAALPLLRRFGATSAVRASAYLYNRLEDFDRLAAALRSLVSPPTA